MTCARLAFPVNIITNSFGFLIATSTLRIDAQYVKIKIITCYVTALLDTTLAYIRSLTLNFLLCEERRSTLRRLFTFNHQRR